MKRIMLFLSVAALLVALAAPAMARDRDIEFDNGGFFVSDGGFFIDDDDFFFDDGVSSLELGQESESGDVDLSFEVSSSGDFASQCVAPLQFGNSGNLQNSQGFVQFGSDFDDAEFEGSSFEFSPSVETVCDQTVEQSPLPPAKSQSRFNREEAGSFGGPPLLPMSALRCSRSPFSLGSRSELEVRWRALYGRYEMGAGCPPRPRMVGDFPPTRVTGGQTAG